MVSGVGASGEPFPDAPHRLGDHDEPAAGPQRFARTAMTKGRSERAADETVRGPRVTGRRACRAESSPLIARKAGALVSSRGWQRRGGGVIIR